MKSKGNVLFGGLKRLLQRMLFIALLVFYLAVRLVQTKLVYLPLNTATNLSNSYSNDMLTVKFSGSAARSFHVYKEAN